MVVVLAGTRALLYPKKVNRIMETGDGETGQGEGR